MLVNDLRTVMYFDAILPNTSCRHQKLDHNRFSAVQASSWEVADNVLVVDINAAGKKPKIDSSNCSTDPPIYAEQYF